jgi:hypothetical protein
MKIERRNSHGLLSDRGGSGTIRLALSAAAILLASLILGDELARFALNDASSKMSLARNAPSLRDKEVDSMPTGAIPDRSRSAGRTPCGERDE